MTTLRERLLSIKHLQPQFNNAELAKQLAISEGMALACQIGADVIRLDLTDIEKLLRGIKKLGVVTAHVQNNQVYNQITGMYEKVYVSQMGDNKMGLAINPGGIDLRLFLNKWHCAFICTANSYKSIQFFDKYGVAVQKVNLTSDTPLDTLEQFISLFKHEDQITLVSFEEKLLLGEPKTTPPQIDMKAFRNDWASLEDIHQFSGVLEKYQLDRIHAYQLIGEQWATEIPSSLIASSLFTELKRSKTEFMAFVGNDGAVQIASGHALGVNHLGQWCVISGNEFQLDINMSEIESVFLVKKPTDNGKLVVSSIEFFNKNNETVLTLFGRRQEGNTLDPEWTDLVCSLWQIANS